MRSEIRVAMKNIVELAELRHRPAWQLAPFATPLGLWNAVGATDGCVFLACPGETPKRAPDASKLSALFDERDRWETVPMRELLSWLGVESLATECGRCGGAREVTCSACLGSGSIRHNCRCDFCQVDNEPCGRCDGALKEDCDCIERPQAHAWRDPGFLFGIPFDRRMLRRALPALDEDVALGFSTLAKAMTVIGDDWCAVAVGLRDAPEDAPRFREAAE